jgi:hypothetical protein
LSASPTRNRRSRSTTAIVGAYRVLPGGRLRRCLDASTPWLADELAKEERWIKAQERTIARKVNEKLVAEKTSSTSAPGSS